MSVPRWHFTNLHWELKSAVSERYDVKGFWRSDTSVLQISSIIKSFSGITLATDFTTDLLNVCNLNCQRDEMDGVDLNVSFFVFYKSFLSADLTRWLMVLNGSPVFDRTGQMTAVQQDEAMSLLWSALLAMLFMHNNMLCALHLQWHYQI